LKYTSRAATFQGGLRCIEFKPEWFDYTKDDAPDRSPGDLARRA
jgi:hypothetical protein